MVNEFKRMAGVAVLLSAAALFPASLQAKTLYVDAVNGNDATTYANNGPSTPWRTIARAAWGSTDRGARVSSQAARAGDVVLVAAGTYATLATNERNIPALYTENEGTSDSPITFRAVGTVNLTLTGGSGPVVGSYDRDYIIWDGFTIHEATAPSRPDTGPVTIWFCNGCQILNMDINGNGDGGGRMDNHGGIRIEQSRNLLIRNNRIQNVYTDHNANNGSGIMVYSSGAITFEHNEIFNCGSGIFLKGGPATNNDYFTIRYNLLYNIGEQRDGGVSGNAIIAHAGAPNRPEAPVRIYQNVVRDSLQAAVRIWHFDGVDPTNNPLNVKIVNNTFENVESGLWVDRDPLPNAQHVFWNNIVTNSRQMIAYNGSLYADNTRFDSEHNLSYNNTQFAAMTDGNVTVTTWRSRTGQDTAAPASSTSNPLFVNEAGNDFRLQAGSPARTLGVDWMDLNGNGSTTETVPAGAYVTGSEAIGRTSGSTTPPPPPAPAAPTNVRIIR